jgi:hypothetical protein
MGNLFALYGKANCGKSETIRNVFGLLQSKYPSAAVNQIYSGTDIKVIMTGVKGLSVGIESQGDPNSRLGQSLIDFENAGCDIIFCASRTSGMTVNWIKSHSGTYTIDWTHQNYVSAKSGHATNNQTVAGNLIAKAGL